MLKFFLKKIIPSRLYNFIRMKPRLVVISAHLYEKIKYLNKSAWYLNPDDRGDFLGTIRKSAHIIDKGLQSPARASGHSRGVYQILKRELEKNNSGNDCDTTLWAAEIKSVYERLQAGAVREDEYKYFPFLNKSSIDESVLFEFIRERRSIRHFRNDVLPERSLIVKALGYSIWGPSSCNRQTVVSFFTVNELLANSCVSLNKGATSISGKFAFVSVCYDTRSYHLPQEILTGYIDVSLGFQNALLAFHSMGLGACVLNWSHSDKSENSKLRDILKIPDYCEIAFNVIVGVPSVGAPVPGKKEYGEFMVEVL